MKNYMFNTLDEMREKAKNEPGFDAKVFTLLQWVENDVRHRLRRSETGVLVYHLATSKYTDAHIDAFASIATAHGYQVSSDTYQHSELPYEHKLLIVRY